MRIKARHADVSGMHSLQSVMGSDTLLDLATQKRYLLQPIYPRVMVITPFENFIWWIPMKKFSEKLLKEITSKVKNAALNKNLSSYELSIQLWEAKNVINWKLTSYGSWKVFVEKELRVMSYTCICKYLTVINKIRKFDYLDKDCRYMITELGWARFMVCVILQKRRMDPKRFVTKYYNFDTNYQNPNRSRAHGDRAYTFALPTEQADVIDGYLLNMGMTVGPNGGRRGVREAFIKLIDTELES